MFLLILEPDTGLGSAVVGNSGVNPSRLTRLDQVESGVSLFTVFNETQLNNCTAIFMHIISTYFK